MSNFLDTKFICEHCHKISKTEVSFLSHRCKQMERMEMLRTKEGLLGKSVHDYWLSVLRKKPLTNALYVQTSTCTSFTTFAQFIFETKFDDWKPYVKMMALNKVTPKNWLHTDIINYYTKMVSSARYEEYVMSELDIILRTPAIQTYLRNVSPLELLRDVLMFRVPVVIALFSPKHREMLQTLRVRELKKFDDFCLNHNVKDIIRDKEFVKRIKTLIGYLSI